MQWPRGKSSPSQQRQVVIAAFDSSTRRPLLRVHRRRALAGSCRMFSTFLQVSRRGPPSAREVPLRPSFVSLLPGPAAPRRAALLRPRSIGRARRMARAPLRVRLLSIGSALCSICVLILHPALRLAFCALHWQPVLGVHALTLLCRCQCV